MKYLKERCKIPKDVFSITWRGMLKGMTEIDMQSIYKYDTILYTGSDDLKKCKILVLCYLITYF